MFQSCTNFFLYRIAFPLSVSWRFSLSLWILDANKILDSDSFHITCLLLKLLLYSFYGFFAQWVSAASSQQALAKMKIRCIVRVERELKVRYSTWLCIALRRCLKLPKPLTWAAEHTETWSSTAPSVRAHCGSSTRTTSFCDLLSTLPVIAIREAVICRFMEIMWLDQFSVR